MKGNILKYLIRVPAKQACETSHLFEGFYQALLRKNNASNKIILIKIQILCTVFPRDWVGTISSEFINEFESSVTFNRNRHLRPGVVYVSTYSSVCFNNTW